LKTTFFLLGFLSPADLASFAVSAVLSVVCSNVPTVADGSMTFFGPASSKVEGVCSSLSGTSSTACSVESAS